MCLRKGWALTCREAPKNMEYVLLYYIIVEHILKYIEHPPVSTKPVIEPQL